MPDGVPAAPTRPGRKGNQRLAGRQRRIEGQRAAAGDQDPSHAETGPPLSSPDDAFAQDPDGESTTPVLRAALAATALIVFADVPVAWYERGAGAAAMKVVSGVTLAGVVWGVIGLLVLRHRRRSRRHDEPAEARPATDPARPDAALP